MEKEVLKIAKRKCGQADLKKIRTYNICLDYRMNELDSLSSHESFQLGIRVKKDNKIGVAYTLREEFDPNELVEKAILNSIYGPECLFDMPKNDDYYFPKKMDKTISEFSTLNLKEFLLSEMNKLIDRGLVISSSISKTLGESTFLNTNGIKYKSKGASVDFNVNLQKNEEGNLLWLIEGATSRRFDKNLTQVTKDIKNNYQLSKNTTLIKSGIYDVYFHPDMVVEILDVVLLGLNGKSIMLNTSPLVNFLGKKKFDERITIEENPHLDFGLSSNGIDSEGVKTYKKFLVKSGVIKTFFYDLQTASKTGNVSTGNGSRSLESQASPSLTNVIVGNGNKEEAKIIKNIKDGIYLKSVMGGFTNNPHTGDMSVNVDLAFKIKNGEIIGRIKDTMLYFNIFDILTKGIVEISKEQKWSGDMLVPGILFRDISISA